MARGVSEVLSLYLDGPAASAPPRRNPRAAPGGDRRGDDALWVPDAEGPISRFLIWNLNCALAALGRPPRVRALRGERAESGTRLLLLLHASPTGMERAERALSTLRPARAPALVVYGEDLGVLRDGRVWADPVAARHTPAPRLRGVLETGCVLARSILSGEPVVAQGGAARERWLRVSEQIVS